jgi:hypothetical protein
LRPVTGAFVFCVVADNGTPALSSLREDMLRAKTRVIKRPKFKANRKNAE